MFDPSLIPRVFGIAPGIDFPRALAEGLGTKMHGKPPADMARIEVIVNTRRMARRMRDLFDAGPALLLPRIRVLSELEGLSDTLTVAQPAPPLRRRLELIQLVADLLDKQPDLAPRASLYDLADSLAALLDEMQGEGVPASAVENLDVTDQSGHWERAKTFINIAQTYVGLSQDNPDAEARQRLIVDGLIAQWDQNPPQHPIILAGSTGSRGTTMLLMQAIAKLPQGAVVLPGFDFDMKDTAWHSLSDEMLSEDHPQYRFYKLMRALDLLRPDVKEWDAHTAPAPSRNKLVSLALRPAPVTDAWLTEGPSLQDIPAGLKDVTLVQAETPRDEALAIAMRLRKAAEDGQSAALITPDRMLSRQVSAALDRWDILPDDSAGAPLHLSPPGRFLRHIAGLFTRKLDTEALLTLLKHPLTHSAEDRGTHQLNTQRLELRARREGLPYPTPDGIDRIASLAATKLEKPDAFTDWAAWVGQTLCAHHDTQDRSLTDWVAAHMHLAEAVATGQTGSDTGELWKKGAGQEALLVMQNLSDNAEYGGDMSASDYSDLVGALLSAGEVRDRDAPHPNVMIWGTLEARVQGADLVILGGLNEGTWPEAPKPDPWLNRSMRNAAGLLLPERRIGLSAHDFQQAIAAPEVWITRSVRSDDAETVPSRWLNRLQNLLNGLPEQGGKTALEDMVKRGDQWLAMAHALEEPTPVARAYRPSPRPPLSARPHALSVTEIKRLIRDPYAVYAKHALRLRPLNAISPSPDAPMRGILIHSVMEQFVKDVHDDPSLLNATHLMAIAEQILTAEVPWPAARTLWLSRLSRVTDWFVEREMTRRKNGTPIALEKKAKGVMDMPDLGFTLTGYADRIDQTSAHSVSVYDYKTGAPPSAKEQARFDKQLLIEAAMLERGDFKHVGAKSVDEAVFIGLGSNPVEVRAPLDKEPPAKVLDELAQLIRSYLSEDQGFTAQRVPKSERETGDYDQLARFGEWDGTDAPVPEDLK
ncbi:double-strand break repair protein AddB [Pseudosulfitobacter sp. SM2401]|uniref:double-strand break repair protein AddB n=1 Tax=Pseudosulfitobacter sp. SM2401 TaxID=3350098 RepID=UPI0036F370C6